MESHQVFKADAVILNFSPVEQIDLGLFAQHTGNAGRKGRQAKQIKELLKQPNPVPGGLEGNPDIFPERVDRQRAANTVGNELGEMFE